MATAVQKTPTDAQPVSGSPSWRSRLMLDQPASETR